MKLVTSETNGLRKKSLFLFNFFLIILFIFLVFFFNEWNFQDWIKLIDLESRAEIKLIVIFFCGESMTFLS